MRQVLKRPVRPQPSFRKRSETHHRARMVQHCPRRLSAMISEALLGYGEGLLDPSLTLRHRRICRRSSAGCMFRILDARSRTDDSGDGMADRFALEFCPCLGRRPSLWLSLSDPSALLQSLSRVYCSNFSSHYHDTAITEVRG